MQNKFKGFRSFLKDKGYYIALLLCTAAVGATGYYLLTEKETTPTTEPTSITDSTATSPTVGSNSPSVDKPAANIGSQQSEPTESTTAPTPFTLKKPVAGEVLSQAAMDRLAYNETTRDWRTHEGLDLAAQLGESVFAAADGTVYTIYEDEELGMTVVLHHRDGYSTHYSNLSDDIPVSVGDKLLAGDVLGSVGQSANIEKAAESHLHFSVFRENHPLDPQDFLP